MPAAAVAHAAPNVGDVEDLSLLGFYNRLGLKRRCEFEDVYAQYRLLADKWHPDRHPRGRADCALRNFTAVAEAVYVLGTPSLRARYDRGGRKAVAGMVTFDPFEFYADEFGGEGGGIGVGATPGEELWPQIRTYLPPYVLSAGIAPDWVRVQDPRMRYDGRELLADPLPAIDYTPPPPPLAERRRVCAAANEELRRRTGRAQGPHEPDNTFLDRENKAMGPARLEAFLEDHRRAQRAAAAACVAEVQRRPSLLHQTDLAAAPRAPSSPQPPPPQRPPRQARGRRAGSASQGPQRQTVEKRQGRDGIYRTLSEFLREYKHFREWRQRQHTAAHFPLR